MTVGSGLAKSAHIVVVGNEKGGCGKTTVCMHLAVALLRMGFRVGCVDLDHRQRSLGRYVDNRRSWAERTGVALPVPEMGRVIPSKADMRSQAVAEERRSFDAALAALTRSSDFVLVDCPGSDVPLARYAHTFADTLVTPINDSLLDLDLLGRLDPVTWKIGQAGVYANLVWELRQERRKTHRSGIDWVVTRSRLSNIADRNKQRMAEVLPEMQRVLGFRLADGFGERVVYRYLFLSGLTVLDIGHGGVAIEATKSHEAARAEVCALLDQLWLPRVAERLGRL